MKHNFTYSCFIVLLFFGYYSNAQEANGGEYKFNSSQAPCLTDIQRNEIKSMLVNNTAVLTQQNRLAHPTSTLGGGHVMFEWPIRKADGLNYNDVWAISGYVDHNTSFPNQLTDYNCGTRTYDSAAGYNHQGVDMFTWPFGWKMMDNDEAEIIAAADGQIIAKNDGEFDRSCNFNNNLWNAVYVQHADGSVAWYGHMKNGSVTTKNVGDMVTTGEYLGIIGSSGNSTGPHLHFEVYENNTFTTLIDPYSGTCNSMNDDTWWINQKDYREPNINAAITHSAAPVFPTCPTTEVPNESNQFEPNQMIYFAVYLRDQLAGTTMNLKIIQPNGTVFEQWNHNMASTFNASYWYWNNNVFATVGEWKWEVTYQGQTVTHTFNIGTLSLEDEKFNATSIFPNPFTDLITIKSDSKIVKASIVDVLGKVVKTVENTSQGIKNLNLEAVSNGLYFLTLEGDANQKKTIKLVKE